MDKSEQQTLEEHLQGVYHIKREKFVKINVDRSFALQKVFRDNLRWCLKSNGIRQDQALWAFRANGVRLSHSVFEPPRDRRLYNMLYMSSWSFVLNVPLSDLLNPDFPNYYDPRG